MSSIATFRMTHVSPLKAARILAVLWALSGLVVGFFAQIPDWLRDAMGWMFVIYPLGYALFGFLLTLWTAWCYNGIARRLGGIEWTARVPGPVAAGQPIKTALLDISKLQAAKLMAALYLIFSVPAALLASIPYWAEDSALAWSTVLLLPLGYTVFGFLFTLVEAWVYNGLAARIGGIAFEVVPVASVDGAGIAQA